MASDILHAEAFAKINWDLRILGKRPDHFHELDSVFVNVALSDWLRIETAETLSMTCTDPSLPVDGSNLVMKAAALLQQTAGCKQSAKIHLEKHIPMGGGLGGGSSDAACALTALNRMWNLNWSVEQLAAVGAQVGSDVAYFLYGGWCLCRGRGEIVQPLPGAAQWPAVKLLMVLPPLHVATPLVYKTLSAPQWNGTGGRDAQGVGLRLGEALRALQQGSASGLELRNDLSAAARVVEPRLEAIQGVLEKYFPGRWLMSGSGAAHFAVPPQDGSFGNLDALVQALRDVVPGTRVIETETRAG